MKELGAKTGVLVGQKLPSAGAGTEAGSESPLGHLSESEETFKTESETGDLAAKWNENQTGLAQPYIPWTGRLVPWKVQ